MIEIFLFGERTLWEKSLQLYTLVRFNGIYRILVEPICDSHLRLEKNSTQFSLFNLIHKVLFAQHKIYYAKKGPGYFVYSGSRMCWSEIRLSTGAFQNGCTTRWKPLNTHILGQWRILPVLTRGPAATSPKQWATLSNSCTQTKRGQLTTLQTFGYR